jgi:methionyl-tRNA formyltransferase
VGDRKRYLIATIKSWNIEKAKAFKVKKDEDLAIITDPEELTYERIKQINPRYIFFPHWSWKIPKEIYANFECIVFHMTDLPFGRGGSPLQNLIAKGIYKTKISALKVVEEMDAGPIYLKKDFDISTGSAEDIFKRAADIIFDEMIPWIIKNEPLPKPQKGKPVVFKRRTPEQSDISGLKDVGKVYDHIRMLDGEGYPPAFIETNYLRFEFTGAKKVDGAVEAVVKIIQKEKK